MAVPEGKLLKLLERHRSNPICNNKEQRKHSMQDILCYLARCVCKYQWPPDNETSNNE